VRNVVKRMVKTAAKAASAETHGAQPTDATARTSPAAAQLPPRARCTASATRKKLPPTKTVMNVVSFVAKERASSAPISAGWWDRGRSRKRSVTTMSASVMHAT
jgi:hypothetical protein